MLTRESHVFDSSVKDFDLNIIGFNSLLDLTFNEDGSFEFAVRGNNGIMNSVMSMFSKTNPSVSFGPCTTRGGVSFGNFAIGALN